VATVISIKSIHYFRSGFVAGILISASFVVVKAAPEIRENLPTSVDCAKVKNSPYPSVRCFIEDSTQTGFVTYSYSTPEELQALNTHTHCAQAELRQKYEDGKLVAGIEGEDDRKTRLLYEELERMARGASPQCFPHEAIDIDVNDGEMKISGDKYVDSTVVRPVESSEEDYSNMKEYCANLPSEKMHAPKLMDPTEFEAARIRCSMEWSYFRAIPGKHCIRISEPDEPKGDPRNPCTAGGREDTCWHDNFLCMDRDYGLMWFTDGARENQHCVSWSVPEDDRHTWSDNFLCSPRDYGFVWSVHGKIPGKHCILINEPSHRAFGDVWDNNYLCL